MLQSNPFEWQVMAKGSSSQKEAYKILCETSIFSHLAEFQPAHVGTIGDNIDIEGSDIDIVCSHEDLLKIDAVLFSHFGGISGYRSYHAEIRREPSFVATIPTKIPIEVFAQRIATVEQLGYRHFMLACRLLKFGGELLHQKIRELKRDGVKTEPAFARILSLSGDPYLSLLELESYGDEQLAHLVRESIRLNCM